MAEIAWNLLNTNAPAQVGASFDLVGAWNKGKQNALAMQAAEQEQQMNALEMQKRRRIEAEAPAAAAREKQKAAIERELQLHTIRKQSADTVASVSPEMAWQTFVQEAQRVAQLEGHDPTPALEYGKQLMTKGGPQALQQDATRISLDAKDKLSKMRLVNAGKTTEFAETNPNAPGYSGQPIQMTTSPAQDQSAAVQMRGQDMQEAARRAKAAEDAESAIDVSAITPDEIDVWGKYVNLTGKMPPIGRGKESTKIRLGIIKSAARQALGADQDGIPNIPEKTPAEAAFSMLGDQSDTKAIQGSLNFLEKQVGAMGSFVTNLGMQVDKVKELTKEFKTYDSRLLNVPLRFVRGRIMGSPLQAKYDMYLTEIESEIGKLSTGSSASIAELSTSAQEKWAKIHDKNLSLNDMISLLEETREAGNMRLQSVEKQLNRTKTRMVSRGASTAPAASPRTIGRFQVEVE